MLAVFDLQQIKRVFFFFLNPFFLLPKHLLIQAWNQVRIIDKNLSLLLQVKEIELRALQEGRKEKKKKRPFFYTEFALKLHVCYPKVDSSQLGFQIYNWYVWGKSLLDCKAQILLGYPNLRSLMFSMHLYSKIAKPLQYR